MLNKRAPRWFAFFGGKISEKFGTTCCRYGQNGKPMTPARVQEHYKELEGYLHNWQIGEDSDRLVKYIYLSNYHEAKDLIADIIKIDEHTVRNKPEIELLKGDLLKITLISQPLKGLSQFDFDLAMRINTLKLESYDAMEVSGPKKYRAEVRMKKHEAEQAQIEKLLEETRGSKTGGRDPKSVDN